jgi:1-deoxy-D-xylulose-5-phosphate synthase
MVIMAPKDENELRDLLFTALEHSGPVALRYPRGSGPGVPINKGFRKIEIGKGEIIRKGRDVALLAVGIMVQTASAAAEELAESGIQAEVVNMRFVKPLDEHLVHDLAARFRLLVTLEDNSERGGFGSAVAEVLAQTGQEHPPLLICAIPDRFVDHGSPAQLFAELQLNPAGIARRVRDALGENQSVEQKRALVGSP